MKKVLLMAVAVLASFAAQAQIFSSAATWAKSLTPVNEEGTLAGTHTAVAADGSVFTTGTYNQNLAFGSATLENDNLLSAYLAKYSADGSELWAVGLFGNSRITDVATDAEGNVYVIGSFAGEVEVRSIDGSKTSIRGRQAYGEYVSTRDAAFVVKYDQNGKVVAVREFVPETNPEIVATGMDFAVTPQITPMEVKVSDGNVYVSAQFNGDVTVDEMSWKGRYNNSTEIGIPLDNSSVGIFSLNAADLKGAKSVVTLGAKEVQLNDSPYEAKDITFAVSGSTVYAAFVGVGQLGMQTAAGVENVDLSYAQGAREFGYILAEIGSTTRVKVFNNKTDDAESPFYRVSSMAFENGKLYLSGISEKNNPFKSDMQQNGRTNIFVTSLDASDFSVKWVANDAVDEGAVNTYAEGIADMSISKGKVFVAGYIYNIGNSAISERLNYNIDENGLLTNADNTAYAALADNGKVLSAITNNDKTTTVSVYPLLTPSGIVAVESAKQGKTSVYSINGQYVGTTLNGLPKGVYIVKSADKVEKVLVK